MDEKAEFMKEMASYFEFLSVNRCIVASEFSHVVAVYDFSAGILRMRTAMAASHEEHVQYLLKGIMENVLALRETVLAGLTGAATSIYRTMLNQICMLYYLDIKPELIPLWLSEQQDSYSTPQFRKAFKESTMIETLKANSIYKYISMQNFSDYSKASHASSYGLKQWYTFEPLNTESFNRNLVVNMLVGATQHMCGLQFFLNRLFEGYKENYNFSEATDIFYWSSLVNRAGIGSEMFEEILALYFQGKTPQEINDFVQEKLNAFLNQEL